MYTKTRTCKKQKNTNGYNNKPDSKKKGFFDYSCFEMNYLGEIKSQGRNIRDVSDGKDYKIQWTD